MKSRWIAILLGVSLAFSILAGPAFAATKVTDTTQHNQTFNFTFGPATICGVADSFTVVSHLEESHFVSWSNGHFVLSVMFHTSVYDSSGKLVAFEQAGNATLNGVLTAAGLQHLASQGTGIGICTGASPYPGVAFDYHQGFTVGTNGLIREVHFVGTNCDVIFCNIL